MIQAQEWLDENYLNKQQTKEIEIHHSDNLRGSLTISDYPQLEKIDINLQNNLTHLQINNCPNLKELIVWDSGLTNLNLSNQRKLKKLNLRNNKLTNLNINHLEDLEKLNISINNFAELDISNLINLKELDCWNNKLTSLILPQGDKLEILSLSYNKFQQDLSFLGYLVGLRELRLGNNELYGSLEPLKNMSKLDFLSINDTNIDFGLEYLPDNIKEFDCSTDRKDAKVKAIYNLFANDQGEIELDDCERIENFSQKLQIYKQKQQIQLLQKQQSQFQEQESQINYLELRVTELINLIKTQKEKIIQAFLRLFPEKELLQELIKNYLEFTKFKEQGINSSDYGKKCREYNKKCEKLKDQLWDKLSEEIMSKIEIILKDCEKLVRDELELETKLNDKFKLIESQEKILPQITDSKDNEQKNQLIKHQKTHHEQLLQQEELIKELKEKIYQNSKLLTEARNENQQLQIESKQLNSPALEEQLLKNELILVKKAQEIEQLQEKVKGLEEQLDSLRESQQVAQVQVNPFNK